MEHDESETDTDADGEEDSALNAVENTSLSELIPATLNESEDRLVKFVLEHLGHLYYALQRMTFSGTASLVLQ